MQKNTKHFKSEEERVLHREIFDKLINPGLATFVRYEKPIWYFSPDGGKRCIHPDFVLQGKTEQIRLVIEIDGTNIARRMPSSMTRCGMRP